ncbi:hemin transport system permease protein [Staphylococcus auricularis]|uniref:Putative hemin transport system permease protein HrtB n=1 Tax=Staphylococcus auricularis TaxID=29379 RepID=A0AAP8PPS0_9STAP|nr:ABC transporter permease [Staphylococcus auricularis]MBM0867386.1 ABC transporter permease [Staphylococcus auricularis]PNZ68080.1 ABC transporter permease [Staphylococcus auricularis]QPT06530.1 ABC transporter permease [Staphylococcus auricularis]SQJ15492.1 ABC transporter permease [Staphylococcus auricularis]BCU53048.1 ABC transporter permease [Staphylococcus auricularis]
MKLAIKEMMFYKLRYLLIMFIILLLGVMVLFISALAQGLARENVSLLHDLNADQYILQQSKQPQLQTSQLSHEQQQAISEVTGTEGAQLSSQVLLTKDKEEDVLMMHTAKDHRPTLSEGHYPTQTNEVAVNEKLTGDGLAVGDTMKLKGGKSFKITGILDDAMYAHSSVVMTTEQGFESASKASATFYPVSQLSTDQQTKLNQIDGVKVYDESEITDEIPSYQAEQAPLNMMIVSLFVISAIVLSAFFYVITIQKMSQIGILKAIGIKTKHLLFSLVAQILMATLVSIAVAIALIYSLSMLIPVSMPFHLSLSNVFIVVIVFVIVALIGSALSLIKLFKVDPIEAIGGSM